MPLTPPLSKFGSPSLQKAEAQLDYAMRPKNFEEYHGQSDHKAQLRLFIDASLARGEALDHVLLAGPPGLGKTSLAYVIAQELKTRFRAISAPSIHKPGELAAVLTNLTPREVLFIDEIHRLNASIEELLYPAMEDYQLDLVTGEGPASRVIKLTLAPFTLIGATTRTGLLSAPLRDRFGMIQRLQPYSHEELARILQNNAEKLKVKLEPSASLLLAERARGTPRIANRLLRRTRDVAQLSSGATIGRPQVERVLALLKIDRLGLDEQDRRLLHALLETFEGKAVGVETLSAFLGESKEGLEEVVEPYLIQQGFLQRTPRGRIATERAKQHLEETQTSEEASQDLVKARNY